MSGEQRTEEPHDRLTRLADVAIRALAADPEYLDGDKVIVFLDNGQRGGLVLHGYDSDADAISDLLLHLRAIFRANGKDLMIAALGEG